ncbi:MAG: F420-dependent oxidoreductase, partial [Actinomycetota bacterium]
MASVGRDISQLEMVGGTRGQFRDASSVADLDEALASIPPQLERGFTTICIKPSQFIDESAEIGPFCRDVVARVTELIG